MVLICLFALLSSSILAAEPGAQKIVEESQAAHDSQTTRAARLLSKINKKSSPLEEGRRGVSHNAYKEVKTQLAMDKFQRTIGSCASCQSKTFLSQFASFPETLKKELKSDLLIFVSSSLPVASLKALFSQAQMMGGRLVFQGLIENSFAKTKTFFETHQINGEIDPQLFADHQIQEVPTFILREGQQRDKVAGNISVFEALTLIRQKGDLKKTASSMLKKTGSKK